MMCDACGVKINIMSKKVCGDCHQNFCSNCVGTRHPKGPYVCQKCEVFSHHVIERAELGKLREVDLHYFTRIRAIRTPAGVSRKNLEDIILEHQAKVLVERAKKALQQVKGVVDGINMTDFDRVDGRTPQTAVSSSQSGKTGTTRAGEGGGGSSQPEEEKHQSKRMKEDFDISQVMNLGDLENESQISELSVKQLKIILKRNCLDYKDCVEKQELMERVKRLWLAREKGKEIEAKLAAAGDVQGESEFLCKVCMDAPVDCVLLECGHMLACVTCGRQLAECPVCRQLVVRAVHAFKV